MQKILVTGGSGFIGRKLVQRLVAENCCVRVLVRQRQDGCSAGVEVALGDIQDAAAVKSAAIGVDTIFHLAARTPGSSDTGDDDASYRPVNVEGTRNVLEGALAGGARSLIFFSSVHAMGEYSTGCLDETASPAPATAYGRSKLEAESMVRAYTKRSHLQGLCLRLPLVYGPGNKGNIRRMISAIDHHLFPPFPPVSNLRSMVHVTNVVDAAMLAATKRPTSPCYIVTDARPYSTRELYELICVALGRRVPRWHLPLGVLRTVGWMGDVMSRIAHRRFPLDSDSLNKLTTSAWYSSDRIARELGYRPSITFESALPELVASYRTR